MALTKQQKGVDGVEVTIDLETSEPFLSEDNYSRLVGVFPSVILARAIADPRIKLVEITDQRGTLTQRLIPADVILEWSATDYPELNAHLKNVDGVVAELYKLAKFTKPVISYKDACQKWTKQKLKL